LREIEQLCREAVKTRGEAGEEHGPPGEGLRVDEIDKAEIGL
jgi:hypothetical protein